MAYNKFTFEKAVSDFDLHISEWSDAFEGVLPVAPSDWLNMVLAKTLKFGLNIATEKARSEFIVAPILTEVCERVQNRVSLFSGCSFNVNPQRGLSGTCDFLISKSANPKFLEAPVWAIIEAKKGDLDEGLGQCAAEMFASQLFNAKKERPLPAIFGAVTTGYDWRFLRLEGQKLQYQRAHISLDQLDLILGFFAKTIN